MNKANCTKVGHFWPGSKSIKSISRGDGMSLDFRFKVCKRRYLKEVALLKEKVIGNLTDLYGQHEFIIPDYMVGTIFVKLKDIVTTFGVNLKNVAKKISNYLGYSCSLTRRESGVIKLISLDRIKNALEAIVYKKPSIEVENILFF